MKSSATALTGLLLGATSLFASNPIVPDVGMADPHIHIFNNKAYLYCTHDADPKSKAWVMPDWRIWSSSDLVNWKLERTILPAETYIGKSDACWAPDAASLNGKFYLYISNKSIDTGVMVADHPEGPFKDALGKPLLPENLTPAREYDITVLIDGGIPYMAFGAYKAPGSKGFPEGMPYYMVTLNKDMISLAEEPKPIVLTGGFPSDDKPSLHTRNGKYYLAAGANYAIADNIRGPYATRRNEGDDTDKYGLNGRAHGNFFEWNHQWFYIWCRFITMEFKYRESLMTFVHYKDNGDMVYDRDFLDAHYATGVGQYSASWDKIEAEWYMAADNVDKKEKADGGFEIAGIKNGGYLKYPNVKDVPANASITFTASSEKGGEIEVREQSVDGKLLGSCKVPATGGWSSYQQIPCALKNTAGTKDLLLVFKGTSADLLHLDSFKFSR